MPLETPAAPVAPAPVVTPTPTPTPAPEVQATLPLNPHPASVQPPPVRDDVIPIPKATYEEFMGYKATVAKLEADRQAAELARKEADLKAQMEKGQIQEALQLIKKQAEDTANATRAEKLAIEERAKRYALSSEVSKALASEQLVPGGAEQLSQLWANQFIVEQAGDSYAVRTPSFQSVTEFVKSQLAKTEYSHFVRATTTGGTAGTQSTSQTTPTPSAVVQQPPPQVQPKNLGEAILLDFASKTKSVPVDGRINPTAGFGLKATR